MHICIAHGHRQQRGEDGEGWTGGGRGRVEWGTCVMVSTMKKQHLK